MITDKTYTMAVGQSGARRLEILNGVRNPYTFTFLDNLGSLHGKKILDLGCGIGILSVELARRVGPNGSVIAADMSGEQLDIARDIANSLNIKNISFIELAAQDLDSLECSFDIIYSRFLLAHVLNPVTVIQDMIKNLTPGGWLMLEEPVSYASSYCDPENQAFNKWKNMALQHANIFKTDFTIGSKLISIVSDLGLQHLSYQLVQPFLQTQDEKSALWLGLQEVVPLYVKSGIATEEELRQTISELKEFSHDEKYKVASLQYLQIAGRKDC